MELIINYVVYFLLLIEKIDLCFDFFESLLT